MKKKSFFIVMFLIFSFGSFSQNSSDTTNYLTIILKIEGIKNYYPPCEWISYTTQLKGTAPFSFQREGEEPIIYNISVTCPSYLNKLVKSDKNIYRVTLRRSNYSGLNSNSYSLISIYPTLL